MYAVFVYECASVLLLMRSCLLLCSSCCSSTSTKRSHSAGVSSFVCAVLSNCLNWLRVGASTQSIVLLSCLSFMCDSIYVMFFLAYMYAGLCVVVTRLSQSVLDWKCYSITCRLACQVVYYGVLRCNVL